MIAVSLMGSSLESRGVSGLSNAIVGCGSGGAVGLILGFDVFAYFANMSLPEFDGMLDPALRIRAHAQAEAVAGILEPVVLDFDPGVSRSRTRRSTVDAFAIRSSSLTVMNVGGKSLEELDWPV